VNIFGTDYPTPDGTCIRDYIHVSDLARAHLLALEALEKAPENSRPPTCDPLIYNLGNGQGFSVRQVIDVAREVTGHPIPVIESPRRAGDPAVLIASSAKIRREMGWHPKSPELRAMVESAWQWHRAHPDGYPT
jgi:UDP-glucose 4-epimerase